MGIGNRPDLPARSSGGGFCGCRRRRGALATLSPVRLFVSRTNFANINHFALCLYSALPFCRLWPAAREGLKRFAFGQHKRTNRVTTDENRVSMPHLRSYEIGGYTYLPGGFWRTRLGLLSSRPAVCGIFTKGVSIKRGRHPQNRRRPLRGFHPSGCIRINHAEEHVALRRVDRNARIGHTGRTWISKPLIGGSQPHAVGLERPAEIRWPSQAQRVS